MKGYVYFIMDEASGHLKIGYSRDYLDSRLRQLQVGNPSKLELMGYLRGSYNDESRIHRECSAHRIRGEWFENDGPVFLYMIEACDQWRRDNSL